MIDKKSNTFPQDHVFTDSVVQEKLLSFLNAGIWKYNFVSQEVIFDESFYSMIGYVSNPVFPMKIDDVLKLVNPRDKEHFDFLISSGREEFTKKEFEFRIYHKDKNWKWFKNYCETITYTQNGKPEWLIGFIQDISERKNKELISLKYEDLLNRTNEVALIGTWEVDLLNMTVSWSDVTKKIHEVSKSYMPTVETGINFYKEGTHRDNITQLFNKAVSEGVGFDDEFIIITDKKKEKWVRSIGIPVIEKGVCEKVYGVFQDIDEKTRAIRTLASTEEIFRKTFDFAGIGMAMVGTNTEWLRVNQSLCNMLGYTMEEFFELKYPDFTHPEDLKEDEELLKQALAGNLDNYEIEKRYIHKNGKTVWTILTVSIVKNDEGEPIHFLSQLNDITKIKNAEKKVNELLEITKDQNDRLLNFAHIVSHNLRSHSGNLEMLLDLMEVDELELTNNDYFPLLKDAVGHLDETVQNLNEVAVLNTKTELNLLNLNLNEFVDKAISSINSLVLDNSVKIENTVNDKIMVSAIPAYLDSIILNFLTNAIKYQSSNRFPVIKVSAKIEAKYIVLSVEDNGQGIDLEAHGKKLFGMYKTFHKHEDSRGLGLFITRNQIEAMGGKVDVISEVNKGTTFFIYLRYEKN